MAGEEQESSLASGEPGVIAKQMLLQRLRRITGQPGESPERHRQRKYGGRLLQNVLPAASLLRRGLDLRKMSPGARKLISLSAPATWDICP